ncbi:hypothetical protein [Streptomyces zaomyceticus]|uniref:Uncharacterized protein n=1 Tax=Streptomyces zaomyceticus TaxID=68286 RepID=A0ABZ1LMY8_9ACTN|nr:hypothetical protein OG237_42325 [Streptomyces zaomyceticus]
MNDLASAAEQAADDANEPADTLALAVTAAIASEGLGKGLGHEWAIYTPQDAAVVASAINATLQDSVTNLRLLEQAVRHIAARGEVSIPAPSESGEDNLADALDCLTSTADEIQAHLKLLPTAIRTLDVASCTYQSPQDTYDTVMAVAALFGGQAKTITNLEDCRADQGDADDPCGCVLEISAPGERYFFDYSDSGWSLLRHGAAVTDAEGNMSWTGTSCLDVKDAIVHPHQLVEQIRRIMDVHAAGA